MKITREKILKALGRKSGVTVEGADSRSGAHVKCATAEIARDVERLRMRKAFSHILLVTSLDGKPVW